MAGCFRDRYDAGRSLALKLKSYGGRRDLLVLALPRGGVPVAHVVATALEAPLDVFVVRKLGVPGREELAMGAIASGGVRVLNDEVVRTLQITPQIIERVARVEHGELRRREASYRFDRPAQQPEGRVVILVDDGLATGATMTAAVRAVRQKKPLKLVVAVPIAAPETCQELGDLADEVVCAVTPEPFFSVGQWYDDFSQTTDDEVRELLGRHR